MVLVRIPAAAARLQKLAMASAQAHPARLEGNGCHSGTRELKGKRAVNSPLKKSRENLRHDQSPSNYKTVPERLASGGRASG